MNQNDQDVIFVPRGNDVRKKNKIISNYCSKSMNLRMPALLSGNLASLINNSQEFKPRSVSESQESKSSAPETPKPEVLDIDQPGPSTSAFVQKPASAVAKPETEVKVLQSTKSARQPALPAEDEPDYDDANVILDWCKFP